MIAVDTNILVYAHREDSSWHAKASEKVRWLVETGLDWGIPWPCVHEFLAIVTHPKIYRPPTPFALAVAQVDAWLASPTIRLIGEGNRYWDLLKDNLTQSKAVGPVVHDARIVTLCREFGVTCLWTADRDFSRFGSVKVENPLIRKKVSVTQSNVSTQ